MTTESPKVVSIAWGIVEVEGAGRFRDVMLYPGGAKEWDWGATGTHHFPGVQPADVADLVAAGATVIVLSRGMDLRLHVMSETGQALREQGVTVHIVQTEEAVRLYNDLAAEGTAVGALIHSTC
ncbi:hypothetical protein Cs7R123_18760 [Catellatospora sp. TT07R-123]|uniref:Mth938-like domain-containing protein n=1 Tax=Catellatospora sp. TT07R-123 TaxID=2733863 RepID=UPI001B1558CE|nr:MTH938/NDUFAF3 family protein [Catellatospora sp. TT07R-123]GHJ44534.1 hypothetical protein Cs7R123_18760 [Catellatospora sp. TT07R-123]